MQWSEEQSPILDWFASPNPERPYVVVDAGAGCGKTTTIVEGTDRAPEQSILYCAFAVKNKEEAQARIKNPRVTVVTLNGLGNRFVKRVWPQSRPDATGKVEWDRITQVIGPREPGEAASAIHSLVGFAKNTLEMPTVEQLIELGNERMIEADAQGWDIERIARAALDVLKLSCVPDKWNRISFNDQIWLPIVMKWVVPMFDLVVVDEAQDMNWSQLMMAIGACKPGGRIAIVGDDNQAIYYFRGAASGGLEAMKALLKATVFGLMTTRRCAKLIVEDAAAIVPGYKAHPDAPLGIKDTISLSKVVSEAQPGNVILSRLNAPLMPLCLAFIRNGIPAKVEGREIGTELIALVKKLKGNSVDDFLDKLNQWEQTNIARALKSEDGARKADAISDKAETLRALASDSSVQSVTDLINRISSIFDKINGDKSKLITLSSTHKAKGLEWDRVFLIKSTYMRPVFMKNPKTTKEEKNLLYVAITRAKNHLTYVS